MGFADSPIINAPFEKPQWHFELDGDGQPARSWPGGERAGTSFPRRRRGGVDHSKAPSKVPFDPAKAFTA